MGGIIDDPRKPIAIGQSEHWLCEKQLAAKDAEIAQLRSENEQLKELAGCVHQYIGAEGGEARFLDALSAASEGKPFNTEHLLPYCPPETNEVSNRETLLERQLEAENAALREKVDALEKKISMITENIKTAMKGE